MKRVILVIVILLILLLLLFAILKGCSEINKPSSGDVEPEVVINNDVPQGLSGDLNNYFTDRLCIGIASITPENEQATATKYFNSYAEYEALDKYEYNTESEYVAKFLFIPKDESVSLDICRVIITEEGSVEPDEVIESGINKPVVFCYDDYESIMPRFGLLLKTSEYEDFTPLSFSGYDGSVNIYGHESQIIDLTIYE